MLRIKAISLPWPLMVGPTALSSHFFIFWKMLPSHLQIYCICYITDFWRKKIPNPNYHHKNKICMRFRPQFLTYSHLPETINAILSVKLFYFHKNIPHLKMVKLKHVFSFQSVYDHWSIIRKNEVSYNCSVHCSCSWSTINELFSLRFSGERRKKKLEILKFQHNRNDRSVFAECRYEPCDYIYNRIDLCTDLFLMTFMWMHASLTE